MHGKLIIDVLREAVRLEGSAQAVASRMRAPEATLHRWLEGRAQMPLRAFFAALEFVMEAERKAPGEPAPALQAPTGGLAFPLGPLLARCARCDGTQFALLGAAPLRLTSVLRCQACNEQVVHGNLLAALAKDVVLQSRAVAVRTRRAVEDSRRRRDRGAQAVRSSVRRIRRP